MMKELKDLYIIGAGGFGREVAWLVERLNEKEPTWNLKGFVDDDVSMHGTIQGGYPVVDRCDYLRKVTEETWCVCAIANVKNRKKIINRISDNIKIHFATLIDPQVVCSSRVEIGEGTIICAGTVVSVDVVIGKHVIVDWNCTIGHDDIIGNYVTLYPNVNISGCVSVGECTELGTGIQIIQGKKICENVIVGAGSVVVKDIAKEGTYVGVPVGKVK